MKASNLISYICVLTVCGLATCLTTQLFIYGFCHWCTSGGPNETSPVLCKRDKLNSSEFAKHFNHERIVQSQRAERWLTEMKKSRLTMKDPVMVSRRNTEWNAALQSSPGPVAEVVVCVISVQRRLPPSAQHDNYLLESLLSVWTQLGYQNLEHSGRIVAKIPNAPNPEHKSTPVQVQGRAVAKNIRLKTVLCLPDRTISSYDDLLPVITWAAPKIDNNPRVIPNISESSKYHSTTQKELEDYTYCLKESLRTHKGADYILALEDDARLSVNFASKLFSVVTQVDNIAHSSLAYVKLFHPERLRKINFYPQMIALNIACVWTIWSVLVSLVRWASRDQMGSTKLTLVLGLLGCGLIYLCFRQITNQITPHVWAQFRYQLTGSVYLTMPESCCTQAVIFPIVNFHKVIEQLEAQETSAEKAKDHILDEIPSRSGLTGLMTDHNLVQHIGRFSSLHPMGVPAHLLN